MRCSPLVRISRSGSGTPAVSSSRSNRASSMPLGGELARRDPLRQAAGRPQDLVARAVVDADVDVDAACCLRVMVSASAMSRTMSGARPSRLPMTPQPRAVLVQLLELAAQVVAQQPHQVADLVGRPRPVLGREGEQRQDGNAELARAAHDAAHRVGAAAMAGDARQAARLRPPAVAIHDDGDVVRPRSPARDWRAAAQSTSDRLDLFFLVGQRLVDLLDVAVGQLLHLVGLLAVLVLARSCGPSRPS